MFLASLLNPSRIALTVDKSGILRYHDYVPCPAALDTVPLQRVEDPLMKWQGTKRDTARLSRACWIGISGSNKYNTFTRVTPLGATLFLSSFQYQQLYFCCDFTTFPLQKSCLKPSKLYFQNVVLFCNAILQRKPLKNNNLERFCKRS